MTKILISTIYTSYSIIASANRFSVDKIILIIDKKPNETMQENIDLIDASLGSVLKIDKVKTEIYDIVSIAKQIVAVIDEIPEKDDIYIDITAGRKTKSLALLFAAYARSKHIKKIVYVTEDTKQIITLPKMAYTLNATQTTSLEIIKKASSVTTVKIAQKLGFTKAIVYRNIRELLEIDAIEKNGEELKLTDFGEILLL